MCVVKRKKKRKEKNTFLVFVPHAGEQRKKWKTYPLQEQCLQFALFCFEIVEELFSFYFFSCLSHSKGQQETVKMMQMN